jgi:hypothetical protein
MKLIRSIVSSSPVIEKVAGWVYRTTAKLVKFPGSKNYWEKRYASGGDSGTGSYNALAGFKAEVINAFVEKQNIKSLIEFGCGDGNQLALSKYPSYMGLDVSITILNACIDKFKNDSTKSFYLYDSNAFHDNHHLFKADVSMSLDVIYHLVEDHVFDKYMRHLFAAAERYVIIYSSNFETEQVYHERDRKFTDWVDGNQPLWKLKDKVENKFKGTDLTFASKADFYIYHKV